MQCADIYHYIHCSDSLGTKMLGADLVNATAQAAAQAMLEKCNSTTQALLAIPSSRSSHELGSVSSSHPELTLLASVDALSNSFLPHNPPRSGRQCEVCGSHVSHVLFVVSPGWRNTRTGIRTACAASALISSAISQCTEMKVMPRGHTSRGPAAAWKAFLAIRRKSPSSAVRNGTSSFPLNVHVLPLASK
jgi:hypothetical protein